MGDVEVYVEDFSCGLERGRFTDALYSINHTRYWFKLEDVPAEYLAYNRDNYKLFEHLPAAEIENLLGDYYDYYLDWCGETDEDVGEQDTD